MQTDKKDFFDTLAEDDNQAIKTEVETPKTEIKTETEIKPIVVLPEKKKAQVNTGTEIRPLIPTDLDGAWRMATAFANSKLLPKSYGNAAPEEMAAKAFLAMQLGAEVGLSPMQAIQSVAIVNGQPSIWGDAQLAIVRNSGKMTSFTETFEGDDNKETWKATCTASRGDETVSNSFTWQDAKTAGLTSKSGTWQTHPKRMMKYKARAFTLRDLFTDVLKGLVHSVEEMEGERVMKDVTPDPIAGKLNVEYLGAEE